MLAILYIIFFIYLFVYQCWLWIKRNTVFFLYVFGMVKNLLKAFNIVLPNWPCHLGECEFVLTTCQ